MGRVVIVAYRPKPDCQQALEALVHTHVPRLRALGLATDRPATRMRAADGTVLEVFEWVSVDAIEAAHSHPEVQAMWGEFAQVCEYLPMGAVAEAEALFSEFEPLGDSD